MVRRLLQVMIAVLFLLFGNGYEGFGQREAEDRFEGWENIKHPVPGWLQDAKFGIYFHWGVYTVPAFNSEWYSRGMYIPGSTSNQHYAATHVSLKEFGYKDYVPLFR